MKTTYLPQYQQFLARLRQARKTAGMTQAELAERLGQPQSFVSKYENGERGLDIVEFLHIAQILRIDAAQLVADLGAALGVQGRSAAARRRRRPSEP